MDDKTKLESCSDGGKPGPIEEHCPVAATVKLIGGKYKTLILWNLLEQTLRFSQLSRAIPCATPKMLTQQLRELETNGIIQREMFPEIPPRVEYSLTDFGRSLRPVLEAMHAWGRGYLDLKDRAGCNSKATTRCVG